MANTTPRVDLWLMKVRLSYPNLFEPSSYKPDQDPKYSAVLVMKNDHPQLKEIKDHIVKLLKDKYGDDAQKEWRKMKRENKAVIHAGEEKEDTVGFDDTVSYVNAYSQASNRPSVAHRTRKPAYEKDNLFYPGCYVNAKISLYCGKAGGVGVGLQAVQFVEDGERLGGPAPVTEEDFPDMGDETEPGGDWDGEGDNTDEDESFE